MGIRVNRIPFLLLYYGGFRLMKTIKLTDDQFNTLFFRIDRTVKLIIDASVEYQNSDLLNEYEDLFDVHSVLESVNNQFN